MGLEIRLVNYDNDLPELAMMLDQVMTDGMTESRYKDWLNGPKPVNRHVVAASDSGSIMGWALLNRPANQPENQGFTSLIVHPNHRGVGIGSALIEDVFAYCRTIGLSQLKSRIKDDEPAWLAWAVSKGFSIERHSYRSSIKLHNFDATPYENLIAKLTYEDIIFTTLHDLGDTEVNRRFYYEADCKAAIDIPGEDSVETWEQFSTENFESEGYRPQGMHVAMDGGIIVGVAHSWLDVGRNRMVNAMTGVIPEYRGRGIATALKVKTIEYARDCGVSEILTQNDSENAPMLAINEKLGYKRWCWPGTYVLQGTIN